MLRRRGERLYCATPMTSWASHQRRRVRVLNEQSLTDGICIRPQPRSQDLIDDNGLLARLRIAGIEARPLTIGMASVSKNPGVTRCCGTRIASSGVDGAWPGRKTGTTHAAGGSVGGNRTNARIPPRQAIRGGAADCGNSLTLSLDRSRSGVASSESKRRARHRNRDPNGAFERCESRERRR